jgi:menaquinone-dependent protoporphyrinogen oxidase
MTKILVAYATAAGSTGEIAELVGKTLRERGATVDVHPAKEMTDLSEYGAVVLGTGIRIGKPYSDAVTFLKTHQALLSEMPVAGFVVCGAMKEETEESCREAESYLDTLFGNAPSVKPVAKGLFGGAIDPDKLSWPMRMMMKKLLKEPGGDYRNWDAIRDWAVEVHPALVGK